MKSDMTLLPIFTAGKNGVPLYLTQGTSVAKADIDINHNIFIFLLLYIMELLVCLQTI